MSSIEVEYPPQAQSPTLNLSDINVTVPTLEHEDTPIHLVPVTDAAQDLLSSFVNVAYT